VASPLVLVLGGTRSGKSRHALELVRGWAGDGRAWFLATARPGDPELDARIALHRAHRPASWPTLEVGVDLAAAVAQTTPAEPLLLDGLTLWLSTLAGHDPVDPDPILAGPVEAALEALAERPGPACVVSDELGIGLTPLHAGARSFRDLTGLAHQAVAAVADDVRFVIAGLPLRLKP